MSGVPLYRHSKGPAPSNPRRRFERNSVEGEGRKLARRLVDVLDDPELLLELAHRRLELAVEDAPVADQ